MPEISAYPSAATNIGEKTDQPVEESSNQEPDTPASDTQSKDEAVEKAETPEKEVQEKREESPETPVADEETPDTGAETAVDEDPEAKRLEQIRTKRKFVYFLYFF